MRVLLLEGDGIGPEIMAATEAALRAVDAALKLGLELEHQAVGWAAHKAEGSTMPDSLVEAVKAADGVVLGPTDTASYPPPSEGGINPSGGLRKALDLYANLRPSRAYQGVPAPAPTIDVVVARENTEGFYADRTMFAGSGEMMPTPDLALAVRKITRSGSERIMRAGLDLARTRKKRVTLVHKGNVLKLSDGLFRQAALDVARAYPDVTVEERHIDAMATDIVLKPERFDVIVTTNMFGDILSNLCAALAGGLGVAGSLNMGDRWAIAQASHGSAPDIAGRGLANPTALMLSTAMLLRWMGEQKQQPKLGKAATALEHAVERVLADPGKRTPDLGGKASTAEFGKAVAEAVGARGR